jgi:hypothetical protein
MLPLPFKLSMDVVSIDDSFLGVFDHQTSLPRIGLTTHNALNLLTHKHTVKCCWETLTTDLGEIVDSEWIICVDDESLNAQ